MSVVVRLDEARGEWVLLAPRVARFPRTSAGDQALGETLSQLGKPCQLWVAGAMVERRLEPLPPLGRKDTAALAAARLRKLWPEHPATAWHIVKGPTGRQLMLAAMKLPAAGHWFIAQLSQWHVPLAGLHDEADARVAALVGQGDLPATGLWLYAEEDSLRQYWVVERHLVFSRQTQRCADGASGPVVLGRLAEHLRSQGYWGSANPMPVALLGPMAWQQALAACLAADGAFAVTLGRPLQEGSDFLAAFAQSGHSGVLPHFGGEALRRGHRRYRYSRYLALGLGAWGVLSGMAILWGVANLSQEKDSQARQRIEIDALESRLTQGAQVSIGPGLKPSEVLQIHDHLRAHERQLDRLSTVWQGLRTLLSQWPDVALEQVAVENPSGKGPAVPTLRFLFSLDGDTPRETQRLQEVLKARLGALGPLTEVTPPPLLGAPPSAFRGHGAVHSPTFLTYRLPLEAAP